MPSSRWLKSVPSSEAPAEQQEQPRPATPNVSMRDVRQLELAKRKREEAREQEQKDDQEKQPAEDSQSSESSQPAASSQLAGQPGGCSLSNQLAASSQPTTGSQPTASNQNPLLVNLLASLPEVKGDARVPHRYTDHLCKLLNPYEQAVYLQLYRLSWGWGKETCFISNPRLSERSNVPLSTMKRVVVALMDKGLIEKTGHTNGFGKDQGVEYRVLSASWQPGQSSQPAVSSQPAAGPIKLNTQKKTHTQEQSSEVDKKDRAPRGVRVGSKFSIEECRKYADHLRSTGQGINNPGGYATKIHRTGEADALIEGFLNPAGVHTPADSAACPDCHGTGFYYPKGIEAGVVKCKHEKLTTEG